MVYQNKLVAAIKVNGQILRESGNTVAVPFGSEYSIFIKNLNSVRVKVRVSIDGDDATGGTSLVIGPDSATELERFIRDGNWQRGNRFKFIERAGVVEAHRGIQAEDGIVRVEYETEKPRPIEQEIVTHYTNTYDYFPRPCYQPWPHYRPHFYGRTSTSTKGMRSASRSSGAVGASAGNTGQHVGNYNSATFAASQTTENTDPGITVAGSVSHQQFYAAEHFETTGQSDVLVLMLRGIVAGKSVKRAITVKTKIACQSCGKTSKSGVEFCDRCGTALVAV